MNYHDELYKTLDSIEDSSCLYYFKDPRLTFSIPTTTLLISLSKILQNHPTNRLITNACLFHIRQ